jgi:inorganic triphosphatase YgiF
MAATAAPLAARDAAIAAEEAIGHIGHPSEAHLRYAESLIGTLPAALHWAAREPYGARALVYALLLDRDAAVRGRQLAHLEEAGEPGLRGHTEHLLTSLRGARREHHLPLIDLAMPALRQLSPAQYRAFKSKLQTLIGMDTRIDLFEWCLSRILLSALAPDFGESRRRLGRWETCPRLGRECALVFSLIAHGDGKDREGAAAAAFAAARTALGLEDLQPVEPARIDHRKLDLALERLSHLEPRGKRALLEGCAAAVLADEQVTPAELEIVRAVGAVIDCPLPPILIPEPAETMGTGPEAYWNRPPAQPASRRGVS